MRWGTGVGCLEMLPVTHAGVLLVSYCSVGWHKIHDCCAKVLRGKLCWVHSRVWGYLTAVDRWGSFVVESVGSLAVQIVVGAVQIAVTVRIAAVQIVAVNQSFAVGDHIEKPPNLVGPNLPSLLLWSVGRGWGSNPPGPVSFVAICPQCICCLS